jgi:hypothetical protein
MIMSDPRNVAHGKKVAQEKQHEHAQPGAGAGAKSDTERTEAPTDKHAPGELEKSVTVLSKLKEMEFHSRANIETLAELSLTIEDELKQTEFSNPVGALYSAQDGFQTQIAALIASYETKCQSLQPPA